jgi:hypothetical protein
MWVDQKVLHLKFLMVEWLASIFAWKGITSEYLNISPFSFYLRSYEARAIHFLLPWMDGFVNE